MIKSEQKVNFSHRFSTLLGNITPCGPLSIVIGWVCLYQITSENRYFRLQKPITFYFLDKLMQFLHVEKQ